MHWKSTNTPPSIIVCKSAIPSRPGSIFLAKNAQNVSTLPLTSLIFAVFVDLYMLYFLIGNNIFTHTDVFFA